MKTTEKMRQKSNFKRGISLLLSFMMSFVFLMANGCNNKPAVIEDYPEVEVAPVEEITDVEVTPVVDEDEEVVVAEETIKREYDSIYETGTFVFNPEAINPVVKEEMKNKEASVKTAKNILNAIHEHKTEFELTGDDEVDDMEFNRGFKLARLASPMARCVDITIVETNKYRISYFPTASENGMEIFEGDTEMSEVENRLNAFEEYITETINNNITADDDYMERARKIYKVLIEDIELVEDEQALENSGYANPMDDLRNSYDTDIIDVPETKKLNHFQFISLYDFFLSELNIEHYVIVAGGDSEDTDVPTESIAETLELVRGNWIWVIVKDEDNKAYNCDILMDKMLLDEQRKTKEDYESDMVYFGISDKTRKESIDFLGRYNAITMNSNTQNYGKDLPDCEEDYNK